MNPMMLWDAEMSDMLREQKKAGLIEVDKECYQLPLDDKGVLSQFQEQFKKLFLYSNGVEIRWYFVKDSAQGGRLNFIEASDVLRDGLGYIYEAEDLEQEGLIEFFKPFDLITDEAECGFLLNPGFDSKAIYYHRAGFPQLHNLDIDFDGYLEMVKEARAFYYWPKVLLDIQSGEESEETKNFKKWMPEIFEEFSWEDFVEKYNALRLSKDQ